MLQIYDGPKQAFGKALKCMRVDYHISQTDLAVEADVCRTSLSDYEQCKSLPTSDTLNKILIALYRHDIGETDENRLRRAWTQAVKASSGKVLGRVLD